MYLCFTYAICKMFIILIVVMRKHDTIIIYLINPCLYISSCFFFITQGLIYAFHRLPHIIVSNANKCKDKKHPACAGRLYFLLFCFFPLPFFLSFLLPSLPSVFLFRSCKSKVGITFYVVLWKLASPLDVLWDVGYQSASKCVYLYKYHTWWNTENPFLFCMPRPTFF